MDDLDKLVAWFETLTPQSVGAIEAHYAIDAYFKDPFNQVRGVGRIRRVFEHMFAQVTEPRFKVTERLAADRRAFLSWDFTFRLRPGAEPLTVRGATHLHFDAEGKVAYHCDYWDAASELYEKVPVFGALMRLARRRLSAPQ